MVVSFHENFWVATSAAAPVIALAVILLLPDGTTSAVRTYLTWQHLKKIPPTPGRRFNPERILARAYLYTAQVSLGASVLNLLVQAALLAVSLWALAYDDNVIPPWAAIVMAVGGLLLLAWNTSATLALKATALTDAQDRTVLEDTPSLRATTAKTSSNADS